MKMESSANSPRLVSQEETQRFFDETRERLFNQTRLNVLSTPNVTHVNNAGVVNINDNNVNNDPIGKKHALKKYYQFALNTSCFWGKYKFKYYPSLCNFTIFY